MTRIHIRAGHVQPLWAGHPWVYAQAIARVEGDAAPGEIVAVMDPKGTLLGRGYWSPKSAIPVRILTRKAEEKPDEAWLHQRVALAAAWRQRWLGLPSTDTDGYRLIHAEGDGLPGLICDVYGQVAVVQLLTLGMFQRREALARAIMECAKVEAVLSVPSKVAQEHEGFESEQQLLQGQLPDSLGFCERGIRYEIEVASLQKTGAYFDQRDNRARVEALARGARVMDAYCYMGGFGLSAARGGAAEVTAIDRSQTALAAGAKASVHAGFGERVTFTQGDVRRVLPSLRQERQLYDLLVLDPPKLAPTVRDLDRARKAYRHLNAQAMGLLSPGGILVSCSCSAAMKAEDFLRVIGMAARDANREAVVLDMGVQAADHPTPAVFSEGRYLKCAFVRVN